LLLFLILAAFTVPRTSLTDWDEGVFALQSRWFSTLGQQGKPYNFQTPPLFQLTAAAVSSIAGSHAAALKWLSVLFSCITAYAVFKLTKRLYSSAAAVYGVIIFMTTEYFLFFSRSGLSDAAYVCFSTLAVLFFVQAIQSCRLKDCLLASLFMIFALYTKFSGIALLVILFFLGVVHRKTLHRFWLLSTVILPVVFFLPFALSYLWVVGAPEMQVRHGSLVGVHHLKYLYYLFIFAPVPLFLTVVQAVRERKKFLQSPIFFITAVFFIMVGFYYPFFRLLYPLIPLCAVMAACTVMGFGRYKPAVFVGVAFSLVLSFQTIIYTTKTPEHVSSSVHMFAEENRVRHVYSTSPPNVLYYLEGDILVPADHPWRATGDRIPFLLGGRTVMYPDSILLLPDDAVIIVHATAVDSLKDAHPVLYDDAVMVSSFEFIDAPVYYKDIYNVQRDIRQLYEIYIVRPGEHMKELWEFGFLRQADVMRLY
jgi:hypothetical protein